MKRDLLTAYAASFARVASWAIVAGLVFRHDGEIAFAAFSYQRVAISVMMISGMGLTPALVILLPKMQSAEAARRVFTIGMLVALLATVALVAGGFAIAGRFPHTEFWNFFGASFLAFLIATGIRLPSDVTGAWLQTHDQLRTDYLLQAGADAMWALAAGVQYAMHPTSARGETLVFVAWAYLVVNLLLIGARFSMMPPNMKRMSLRGTGASPVISSEEHGRGARATTLMLLLSTGGILLAAQIADLLYAPANQAIIKHFLSEKALATYAPLLQIDAALLLCISGLSNLLLPKSAIAHGRGDYMGLRRYYTLGTLGSAAMQMCGAVAVWGMSGLIFKLWFGQALPVTQAILPLVMIHTVIGGSAAIGRSVLLGMGRVRAYTSSAILGGIGNVVLALLLVTQTNLGLKGIVLATIIAVTLRCAVWMPWYTLRALREGEATSGQPTDISGLSPDP